MAYATTAELALYLGVQENELPADAGRMLDRASEEIDYWTRGRAPGATTDGATAVKNAVCALLESWINGGEPVAAATGDIASYTAGKVSVTYAQGGQTTRSATSVAGAKLPPRAYQYLLTAGLLSAGVPVI